jgi:hypothetical protein
MERPWRDLVDIERRCADIGSQVYGWFLTDADWGHAIR